MPKSRILVILCSFISVGAVSLCCCFAYQKHKALECRKDINVAQNIYNDSIAQITASSIHVQLPTGMSPYLEPLSSEISVFLKDRKLQKSVTHLIEENSSVIRSCEQIHGLNLKKTKCEATTKLNLKNIAVFNDFREIKQLLFFYCDRMALAILRKDEQNAAKILFESYYFIQNFQQLNNCAELSGYLQLALIWKKIILTNMLKHFSLSETESHSICLLLKDMKCECNLRYFRFLQNKFFHLSVNNVSEEKNLLKKNISSFLTELDKSINLLQTE